MSLVNDNVSPITGNPMRSKRLPTTKEARPECWSLDGNYLGATPMTWWDDMEVGSLVYFEDDARFVIGMAVLHEWPPPAWIDVCDGLAALPARAWWEWHWYRNIDPFLQRSPIPKKMRQHVIERDGYVCGLCGGDVDQADLHIDHILPVSLGGQNEPSNLQVAHSLCNIKKGNRI